MQEVDPNADVRRLQPLDQSKMPIPRTNGIEEYFRKDIDNL